MKEEKKQLMNNVRITKDKRTNNFYGLIDSYNLYKQLDYKKKVKKKVFNKVVRMYTQFLQDELIENGYASFPENTGYLVIHGRTKKPKINDDGRIVLNRDRRPPINWKETNKLWAEHPELREKREYIYHLNEHTNYVQYATQWVKTKTPLWHKDTMEFTACRKVKRRISNAIQNGAEYLIIK